MSLGTVGKYELLEKIAEGGMGELFRAREIGPQGVERIVALKRIRPSMIQDPRSRQMFIEEARVASLVLHPNLVTLFRFEEEGELLYLVMELVEGRDLAKILARSRQLRDPLRIRSAVRIAEQVAQGLDYLHRLWRNGESLQLVHRDVSPQNVLVSFEGAVKLADFGIAYMRRSEPVTQAGILKGKMGYLTPEQLSETRIDGRADIFCLGIVLWEMLTGARLFQGTSDASILQQVLHKRIPLPSTLNVDVPPALDQVVMRALERDRSRRFERAGDMAAALTAVQGWMANDVELGEELRRYFPGEPEKEGLLPGPAPLESRTESVSTAVDRPRASESVVSTDAIRTATASAAPVPEPRSPPPPPPVTAATLPQPRASARRPPLSRPLLILTGTLMLGGTLGLWWRAHRDGPPISPVAVLAVVAEKAPAANPIVATAETLEPRPTSAMEGPPRTVTLAAAVDVPTQGPSEAKPAPGAARPHRSNAGRPLTLLRATNVVPWAEVVVDGSSLGYTANTWKVAPDITTSSCATARRASSGSSTSIFLRVERFSSEALCVLCSPNWFR